MLIRPSEKSQEWAMGVKVTMILVGGVSRWRCDSVVVSVDRLRNKSWLFFHFLKEQQLYKITFLCLIHDERKENEQQ